MAREHTGIFPPTRPISAADPHAMMKIARAVADSWDFKNILDNDEANALCLLKMHGHEPHRDRQGRWDVDVPGDAKAEVREAESVLHWIDVCRNMLALGDVAGAAACAYRLAVVSTRMPVRKFESIVDYGRSERASRQAGGHKRATKTAENHRRVVRRVNGLVAGGKKKNKAFLIAGPEFNLDPDTVRNIYYRLCKSDPKEKKL